MIIYLLEHIVQEEKILFQIGDYLQLGETLSNLQTLYNKFRLQSTI